MLPSDQINELIENLPFPLAKLYQQFLLNRLHLEEKPLEENIKLYFESLFNTWELMVKLVSIYILANYCDSQNDQQSQIIERKKTDFEKQKDVLSVIANALEQPNLQRWWKLGYDISNTNIFHKLILLPKLLEYNINLPTNLPKDFPINLNPRKMYNWFELVQIPIIGEWQRKSLASNISVLKYWGELLELSLQKCSLLKLEIYIFISHDERKTKGFSCRGTRPKPVSLRGITEDTWNQFQYRPFLYLSESKQYLSLVPFLAAFLQKENGRILFYDLLFFEYSQPHQILFYGYHCGKLLSHNDVDPKIWEFWQKLGELKNYSDSSSFYNQLPINFEKYTEHHSQYFVGRDNIYNSLLEKLKQFPCGYFYLRSESGLGKTAFLSKLFQDIQSINKEEKSEHPLISKDAETRFDINADSFLELFNKRILDPELKNYYFLWHFATNFNGYNDPYIIFQSWYYQIYQKIYRYESHEIQRLIQRLPTNIDSLVRSFLDLLYRCSEEILCSKKQKMILILDGIDVIKAQLPSSPAFLSLLSTKLPAHVYIILSWKLGSESDLLLEHWQKLLKTPCEEITGSPLSKLSFEEVKIWCQRRFASQLIQKKLPLSLDILANILWEKSDQGDPLYLALCSSFFEKIITSNPCLWPTGRGPFISKIWEELPSQDFLGYRMLGLLSHLNTSAKDNLLGIICEKPVNEIKRERLALTSLLLMMQDRYTISHPCIAQFILGQFHRIDHIQFHRQLLEYYFPKSIGKSYRLMSQDSLVSIIPQYQELGDWQLIFSLISDEQFKEQKIQKLKSYVPFLSDVSNGMNICFREKKYREVVLLSYRYHHVLRESLQEMSKCLQLAISRDYALSFEKINMISEETFWLKNLIFLVWCSLYYQDYQDTKKILQEIQNVPNDFFVISPEIEPWFLLIAEQIKQKGMSVLNWITKHNYSGIEAIEYLLRVNQKIKLQGKELASFLHHIFNFLEQITKQTRSSRHDPSIHKYLMSVLLLWKKLETEETYPKLWEHLLRIVAQIQTLSLQLEILENITSAVLSIAKKEYFQFLKLQTVLPKFSLLKDSCDIPNLVVYARLLSSYNLTEEAKTILNIAISNNASENYNKTEVLFRGLFPMLMDSHSNKAVVEVWWQYLQDMLKIKSSNRQSKWIDWLALGFSYRKEWEKSLSLLNSYRPDISVERISIIKEILSHPSFFQETTPTVVWNMLLQEIELLGKVEGQADVLSCISQGLFSLRMPTDNSIWTRYLAITEQIVEEPAKERLLANLAIGFARLGFLTKSQTIMTKISISSRSVALAETVLQLVRRNEFEGALESSKEIPSLKEQFRGLQGIAESIPSQSASKNIWKNLLSVMLKSLLQSRVWEDIQNNVAIIISKFFKDLANIDMISYWHELCQIIEALPYNVPDSASYNGFLQEFSTTFTMGHLANWPRAALIFHLMNELGKISEMKKGHPIWQWIEEAKNRLYLAYPRAVLNLNAFKIALKIGGWNFSELAIWLQEAVSSATNETNKHLSLLIFSHSMVYYRALAKEEEARIVFQEILNVVLHSQKQEISSLSKLLVLLVEINLDDFIIPLLEKTILFPVKEHIELPDSEILLNLAELCLSAQRSQWSRILFFRLLPQVTKEVSQSLTKVTPLYRKMLNLLQKMSKDSNFNDFVELWKQIQEMVANLPTQDMQEDCLVSLANSLYEYGLLEENSQLWEKLCQSISHFLNTGKKNSITEDFDSLHSINKNILSLIHYPFTEEVSRQLKDCFQQRNDFFNKFLMDNSIEKKNHFQEEITQLPEFVNLENVQEWTISHWARLFKIFTPSSQQKIIKMLANSFEQQKKIDSLFELCLWMPDNFEILCFLTNKILSTILSQDKNSFISLVMTIAPYWGLSEFIQPDW